MELADLRAILRPSIAARFFFKSVSWISCTPRPAMSIDHEMPAGNPEEEIRSLFQHLDPRLALPPRSDATLEESKKDLGPGPKPRIPNANPSGRRITTRARNARAKARAAASSGTATNGAVEIPKTRAIRTKLSRSYEGSYPTCRAICS